ncbi:hypothetical protein MNBD_GAMMA22-2222 [hydrothermal vent metagenome]|uniref:Type IV pilus biogenesis protein PilE n=1 Tax=hydrothermal vent metagenome TaxID=652676 RepID=A0A3B1AAT8_9ZZZZ
MKRPILSKKNQQGMTIIELMMVVAIVAILAIIAFNQFGNQQDKGLRAEGVSALMLAVQEFEACGRDRGGVYTLCTIPAAFINSVNNRFTVSIASQTASTYTLSVTRTSAASVDEDCTTISINNLGQKFFTSSNGNGTLARCWSGT